MIKGKYCLASLTIPLPNGTDFNDKQIEEQLKAKLVVASQLQEAFIEKLFYALVQLKGKLFTKGICIPSGCSPDEIQNTINKGIKLVINIINDIFHVDQFFIRLLNYLWKFIQTASLLMTQ